MGLREVSLLQQRLELIRLTRWKVVLTHVQLQFILAAHQQRNLSLLVNLKQSQKVVVNPQKNLQAVNPVPSENNNTLQNLNKSSSIRWLAKNLDRPVLI